MSEVEVNYYLRISEKFAQKLYRQGKKDLADNIITFSSKYALTMLNLYKLNGKVQCTLCKQLSWVAAERDYIRMFGMCLLCDNLLGEHDSEQLKDEELYN